MAKATVPLVQVDVQVVQALVRVRVRAWVRVRVWVRVWVWVLVRVWEGLG